MLWWPLKVADWTNGPSVKHSSLVLSSSCQTHTHSILILPNTNTLNPLQTQAIWCSMFDDVLMDEENFDAQEYLVTVVVVGTGERYVSHIQKPLVLWQENVFWHCVNNIRSQLDSTCDFGASVNKHSTGFYKSFHNSNKTPRMSFSGIPYSTIFSAIKYAPQL